MTTTVAREPRRTRPFYQDMSVQVFAGMAVGALIGWVWPQSAEWMRTLGDLFIRLIAMFVGLIIFCAVVHGIATVREAKKVGRVAIKALIYFEVVTTFALVIGLAMINLLGPGRGMHVDLQSISGSALDPYLKTAQQITGSGFLLSIVPHTAISAFTEGNVLQVVFLSVLFAFGLHAIGADGQPMIEMIELTKRIVFKIIGYIMIMWLAPDRRHGRDRLHRRKVWHRLACLARRNGGRVLSDLYSVHLLSSLADRPLERHQILAFGPLHPNRIADRGRHQLVGIGIPPAR
jgi:L-cystine uptake protein TcyP (sodium:dicarboxylate symporter family)